MHEKLIDKTVLNPNKDTIITEKLDSSQVLFRNSFKVRKSFF